MDYPKQVKNTLLSVLDRMSTQTDTFVKDPARDFTRKRKLGFTDTMLFFLTSGAGTTKHELYRHFEYDVNTPSVSAFCQQRAKLKIEAFRHLTQVINNEYPCEKYHDTYQLIAVDGTDFNIARNPSCKSSYYPPNNKSTRGYNLVSAVPLYDILNKRYLDMDFKGGRERNEHRALCNLVDRFEGQAPAIFLADRGTASYNVFAHMIENDVYFLIRAKDITVERLLGKEPLGDEVFDETVTRILTRSEAKKHRDPTKKDLYRVIDRVVPLDYLGCDPGGEYVLTVRVVRFKLGEHTWENVITNLPGYAFCTQELKELYNLRWEIELSFRDLKHTIGATEFRSGKLEYVEQELWARMILYNLCSIICTHVVVIKYTGLKHVYKINFSLAIKICHDFFRLKAGRPPPDVVALIGSNLLPVRAGRKFNRQKRFRFPSSFAYRFS